MENCNQIPQEIGDGEYLYRGVVEVNWDDERQRPSSATFKDSLGVSVDRDASREKEECINRLINFKSFKAICRVTALAVRSADAVAKYMPTEDNIYHSEIHNTEDKIPLSGGKANRIREQSEVVYLDTSGKE